MLNDDEVQQLLDEYGGFVRKIARTAIKSTSVVDYEDLYQVGEMAVLRAVKTYDPTCGRNVKSYVCSLVRQAIYNEAAKFLGVFTVDHKVTELGARASRLADQGKSDEEISDIFNQSLSRQFSADSVRELRVAYGRRHTVSLEFEIEAGAEEEWSVEEFLESVVKNDEERAILQGRILGTQSAQDIADTLSLSVKRVYDLESKLKARIEHAIRSIV